MSVNKVNFFFAQKRNQLENINRIHFKKDSFYPNLSSGLFKPIYNGAVHTPDKDLMPAQHHAFCEIDTMLLHAAGVT
ncbi:MAG: hypothetical protein ACD_22C00041G0013 [uncultured bacterium]|nr:MAG: hypothetical protein ACD_22C00041G0013 [uncultured bacterium]